MRKKEKIESRLVLLLVVLVLGVLLLASVKAVDPVPPDSIEFIDNETKGAGSVQMANISGGRIATLELNATIQNPRWKGFVGNVTGKFTLDDAAGDTLFDWTIATITGRVYATSNESTPTWASINCSNSSTLNEEDYLMNHSNADDNITSTFNATVDAVSYGTHNPFYVGGIYLDANICPTLNTYNGSGAQDTDFEEIALYDTVNIIYASILEENTNGFDDQSYDFQMIVPENGDPSFAGATAYYIYLEIGT